MNVRKLLAKTPLIARIGALYVLAIVSGVLLFTPSSQIPAEALYAEENPVELQQEATQVAEEEPEIIQGLPVRIELERLALDLAVQPGTYDAETQEWTLNNTDAFFATISQEPGTEPGTTFIYGHNRASAFGPLADVRADDTVVITLEDGTQLGYIYARDARVTPETVSVIYEESEYPQLILMTCDGVFSDVRRVMYFTLQEVL